MSGEPPAAASRSRHGDHGGHRRAARTAGVAAKPRSPGVQASAPYQEAVASFAAGATERVAALAAGDLHRCDFPCRRRASSIGRYRSAAGRSGVHFLPPAEIAPPAFSRSPPKASWQPPSPPELGGDETIAPVLLIGRARWTRRARSRSPSNRTPCRPPSAVSTGATSSSSTPSDFVPTSPSAARRTVNDEWWNVRPDAYREYLEELREALSARALRVVIEP